MSHITQAGLDLIKSLLNRLPPIRGEDSEVNRDKLKALFRCIIGAINSNCVILPNNLASAKEVLPLKLRIEWSECDIKRAENCSAAKSNQCITDIKALFA